MDTPGFYPQGVRDLPGENAAFLKIMFVKL
jgi:hypothetical protein